MNLIRQTAVTLGALAALLSQEAAAAPGARVDEGFIFGTGNVVHLYRVPTTDIGGKVGYFDIDVQLTINDNGKPSGSALVTSAASPKVYGTKYISGTYGDSRYGMTCMVGASVLVQGGRQNGGVSCSGKGGQNLSASWATGPIDGHPFELDMRAAGIDQIGGYVNFGWGTVGSTSSNLFGCMSEGDLVSVAQAGNVLSFTGYDRSNKAQCGFSLVLAS